jgi:hypothetical protein
MFPAGNGSRGNIERKVRLRVRIRFTKQGDLRLIGHLDLLRCLERVFRRAGVALGFSRGFHPKPRMSFPSALAVGIAGLDEIVELELADAGKGDCPRPTCGRCPPERPSGCSAQMGTVPFSGAEELLRRLAPQAPEGMTFRAAEALPDGCRGRFQSAVYEVSLPAPLHAGLSARIARFLDAAAWPIVRGKNRVALDLRPLVRELSFSDGVLQMRLGTSAGGATPGPRDVLAALELADAEASGARLTRAAVEVAP